MKTLYLVSFGDSRKYKISFDGSANELALSPSMTSIKKQLEKYIKEKDPFDSHPLYYASPLIEEIPPYKESAFDSYPELNKEAIDSIQKELVNEVDDQQDLECLNRNAPFDDLN